MNNRIFVAADVASVADARALVAKVATSVAGLKLGLEFFCAHGPAGVAAVMDGRPLPLFIDLKLHDIPNTVASAVASLAPLKPAILTVHAAGGAAMLAAARAAAPSETKIVAVTVLTSLDDHDLLGAGVADGSAAQVLRLARLARDAGIDGIVCSPHEVSAVNAIWPDGLFVVPGVRPEGSALGDQKRVMTPRQARDAGAGVLVIGRPITAASDPGAAAAAIAASLA
jgi:orotidine-5'-phosphate decarboxylase